MVTTFVFTDGKPSNGGTDESLARASARLPAGSYTTLRTYGGNGVVRLDRHARRLVGSLPASLAGASLDAGTVRAAIAHALGATRHPESRVRVTFAPPRLFVSVEPFVPLDDALRRAGVACITVQARRERPEAKDTQFLATARAAYEALPAGIHEGLMVDGDGTILEGLSSNFFAIRDGALRTEETRALHGVTRSMVLEIAAGLVPRGESGLLVPELPGTAEAFITSVSREILPVVRVDAVAIGGGAPGPVTGELIRRFAAAVDAEREAIV